MTKTIWAGAFSAIVGAATIAAMAQAPTPQRNSSTAADQRITVTGCLTAAPPDAVETGAVGTSGASGTTGSTATSGTTGAAGAATDPADAKFVLTDATATPAAADATAAGSTAGSTAAGSTAAGSEPSAAHPAQTYRLVANPASLNPHVGKKLELTGTVVEQTGSTPSASSAAAGSPANPPALKVEAGKVIAASCQE